MADLATILEDPEWFPTALSQDYQSIAFGNTTRTALSSEAFLDQRMSASIRGHQQMPLRDVINASQDIRGTLPSFVFHSAFCCSTLLARALDVSGKCLALKEPDILMGLANALRMQKGSPENATRVDAVTSLLSRRFDNAESVLIKPTNSANNLLPRMLERGAPVLLLYGDLRSFLISVLKKGEACKAFIRTQYNIFTLDEPGVGGIPARQAMTFTDLQVAALVWRHQLEAFQRELVGRPDASVASLDFRHLVDRPAATVTAVAQHLRLPLSAEDVEQVTTGSVFARNAKFGDQAYDAEQRSKDESAVADQHSDALDDVEAWAATLNLGFDFELPLARALTIPG